MEAALVVEQLLAPVPGGTGRYTRELADGLRRTASTGDDVTEWNAWHRSLRTSHPTHGSRLSRRVLAAAWSRGVGPSPRADVVHAPTLLFPPRRARPLVVSIHDAVPLTHPETLTPHGVRWHRRMIARAMREADAITVPSAAVAADLARALDGFPADRVHVLGAGVARGLLTEPDAETRADVRRRLGLPDRFLVTVATLEPRKGLDVLIAALARLGERRAPLVVVGQPGWGGVDLTAATRAAALPDGAVRAIGRIPDDQLGVVLREAQALVAPSRAEGFGLPLVEAMAVGVPVVCTDIPAFREVTAGAALSVPVADAAALGEALERVLSDPDERARLAAAGRTRSGAFDWDDVARRAWTLYRRVLGNPAP